MERLTIDQVIEHCEHKAKSYENCFGIEQLENKPMDINHAIMNPYWEHRQVKTWLEELKAYKDLEEQGLLLRLPCKVGEQFWELNIVNGEPYIYPRFSHSFSHCTYVLERLGKTAFLTKEEAEQALAKMKEGV